MNAEDPAPAAAEKWARIPGEVRKKLRKAIEAHLRSYGSRHYDRLRDDPEFAPFIGTHRGEAGDKRLDRLIRDVKSTLPSLRRSSRVFDDVADDPSAHGRGRQESERTTSVPASTAQILAGTRAAIVGYAQVQHLLEQHLPILDRAIADLHNELGECTDDSKLAVLLRERRATVKDMAALAAQSLATLASSACLERVFERLAAEHPDDPERTRALLGDINDIMRECGGLPATSSELR
jgi:chorismate mutase